MGCLNTQTTFCNGCLHPPLLGQYKGGIILGRLQRVEVVFKQTTRQHFRLFPDLLFPLNPIWFCAACNEAFWFPQRKQKEKKKIQRKSKEENKTGNVRDVCQRPFSRDLMKRDKPVASYLSKFSCGIVATNFGADGTSNSMVFCLCSLCLLVCFGGPVIPKCCHFSVRFAFSLRRYR